jgi:hypothetical protein
MVRDTLVTAILRTGIMVAGIMKYDELVDTLPSKGRAGVGSIGQRK